MHGVALAQSIMASPHRGDESKAEGGEIQEKEYGENESRVDGGGAVCAKSGGNISQHNTIVELFLNHAINFAIWQNLKLAISCLMNPIAI